MKQKAIVIAAILLAFAFISMASATGFSETHGFDGVLEYTVYNKGKSTDNDEDAMTHYHYPDEGGFLIIQCSELMEHESDELMSRIYIKGFINSSDKATENPDRYWSKDIIVGGYYACHSKAIYTINGTAVHDNSYWILTPTHIISLHFSDTEALGAYPFESIPYVIASLNILP